MPEHYRDGVGLLRCRTCQNLVREEDVATAIVELGTLGKNVRLCGCPADAPAREPHYIFDADDPLVLNGTYDREGYKPGERERSAKARARQLKEEDPMAKKSTKRKATKPAKIASTPKRKTVTHRLHTFKGNGAPAESREVAPEPIPIGEAMRRAVDALGEVVIDDGLASAQLRELAELYERVTAEQTAFDEKAEAAKVAKKSVESATNLLLERVRAFTHAAPLPLFDQQQAEQDRSDMLDSAST